MWPALPAGHGLLEQGDHRVAGQIVGKVKTDDLGDHGVTWFPRNGR